MTTPQERAELNQVAADLKALYAAVKARPLGVVEQRIAEDMQELAPLLPGQQDEVCRLILGLGFLSMTDADKQAEAKLIAKHNVIATRVNARIKAKKDAREAAQERAAVRAAMCPKCFCVHAEGECW
jgi:hypothetical protein